MCFLGQDVTQKAMEDIRGRFSSLQLKVRKAMEEQQVKVDDVHQFLVSFFQSDHPIPAVPDLTKVFICISNAKLWDYNSYGALEQMVEEFLPSDESVKASMTDYSNRHSGFCTTIKIVDLADSLLEEEYSDKEYSDEDTLQAFSPDKYKPNFHLLKVKLKLKKKPTEITLGHVNTLWQSLAKTFDLPPLPAVLKKIIVGSIIITWLILPSIAEKIRRSSSKALKFYQHHDIVEVDIDDDPLYMEEWIVSLLLHVYMMCSSKYLFINEDSM